MPKLDSYTVPYHYICLNNFWVIANRLDEKHLKRKNILLKNCVKMTHEVLFFIFNFFLFLFSLEKCRFCSV